VSTTYGQIRFLLSKELPGVDIERLDGYINDRYTAILNRIDWTRVKVQATLTTLAQYSTGTVAATLGSQALTLTGGTWTTQMSGFRIRLAGRSEYYTFTRTGNTTGTLDRNYEGPTIVAAPYVLFQPIYSLAAGAETMQDAALLSPPRTVDRCEQSDLAQIAPNRGEVGAPALWAPYSDDSSSPPLARVELYPAPDQAYDIPYWFTPDATLFGANDTASPMPAWIDPGCLKAGVKADMFASSAPALAQTFEAKFRELLVQMVNKYSRANGGKKIQMADRFTRHRILRVLKGNRTAPFLLP
jgi:hypothetical protein